MKKFTLLLVAIALIASYTLKAQVSINNDGSEPDSSAILDLKSINGGLLLPRMNTIQISGISNPAAGLMVFNTDSSDFYGFNGSIWVSVWNTGDTITPIPTVTNPTTGEIWMDRNLGASQVATSIDDAAAYGYIYQWGRATEGHEDRNSTTTSTIATTAVPDASNEWDSLFITPGSSPYDWLTPQDNTLWQGESGTNNPCPSGFRLPTKEEWEAERSSWSGNNAAGAFASPLKLPLGGYRSRVSGSISDAGSSGYYWCSTISGMQAHYLVFYSIDAFIQSHDRSRGFSVRCIKD